MKKSEIKNFLETNIPITVPSKSDKGLQFPFKSIKARESVIESLTENLTEFLKGYEKVKSGNELWYVDRMRISDNLSYKQINEFCEEHKIRREKTNTARIFDFYAQEEKPLRALKFKFLLKSVPWEIKPLEDD